MVKKYLPVIFTFVLFAGAASAQSFLSEKDIKHPVKMPAGILSSLKKSEVIRQCIQSGDLESADRLKASWFQTAQVNLNDDKLADYVVQGNKPCLDGPRATTFWVFKGRAKGFDNVWEISALMISVNKKKKTRGLYNFNEFETLIGNAVENAWVFDGRKYILKKTKMTDISE
jgi:hypothetical protein